MHVSGILHRFHLLFVLYFAGVCKVRGRLCGGEVKEMLYIFQSVKKYEVVVLSAPLNYIPGSVIPALLKFESEEVQILSTNRPFSFLVYLGKYTSAVFIRCFCSFDI